MWPQEAAKTFVPCMDSRGDRNHKHQHRLPQLLQGQALASIAQAQKSPWTRVANISPVPHYPHFSRSTSLPRPQTIPLPGLFHFPTPYALNTRVPDRRAPGLVIGSQVVLGWVHTEWCGAVALPLFHDRGLQASGSSWYDSSWSPGTRDGHAHGWLWSPSPLRTAHKRSWGASSVSSTSSDTKTFLISPITINEELNLSKGKNHKIE